jgi:O-antigen ligase
VVLIIGQYRKTTGGKLAALFFGVVVLLAVFVFLAFGFVLVLALAGLGLLLGAGAALLRRLSGRPAARAARAARPGRHDLDPSLEVSPPPRALDNPDQEA